MSEKVEVIFENRTRIIYSLLNTDTHFVDLGVNYGQHFINASKRFKKNTNGSCIGYEPSKDCFNYIIEQKLPSIIKNVGISDKSGVGKYIYVEGHNGAWSALDQVLPFVPKSKTTETEIKTVTLDDEFKNEAVDFIKIDIEGGEYNALLGAKELMSKCKPLLVIEQGGAEIGKVYDYNFDDYINLFPKDYTIMGIDFEPYTEAKFYAGMPWMQIAVPKRYMRFIKLIKSICNDKNNSEIILKDHFKDSIRVINKIKDRNNENINFFSIIKIGDEFLNIPILSRIKYFLSNY